MTNTRMARNIDMEVANMGTVRNINESLPLLCINDKHANAEKCRRRGGKHDNSANIHTEVANLGKAINIHTEVANIRMAEHIHAEVANIATQR